MNYKETMKYIGRPQHFGCKLGLERIKKLMAILGNPQEELKCIHVAGTNGKGSTVSMISSVLMEAGYRVGVYTSPYIQRFSERVRINNTEISKEDIVEIINKIKVIIEREPFFEFDPLTEFEIITALAFQYFKEQRCDIVVLETGLGGRLDSTNIIESPEIAVITTINYDHMDYLGNSLSEIAFEKAGIIKEQCDVILYPQEPMIQNVFDEVCRLRNARLYEADFSKLILREFDVTKQIFDFEDYNALEISILGEHQIRNAAVAVKAIEVLRKKGYVISDNALRSGLKSAKWPGRFEIINKKPLVIADGAHNHEGVKSLTHNLQSYFPNQKITFICGVLADKEYEKMMELLIPLAYRFVTVTPENSRALNSEALASLLKARFDNVVACEKIKEAIDFCLSTSLSDEVICILGSLYFMGEVRDYFGLH